MISHKTRTLVVAFFTGLLDDGKYGLRIQSLCLLGTLGSVSELREYVLPHAARMAGMMGDEDGCVRKAAVEALGKLGPHAAFHVMDIARMRTDEDEGAREAAEQVLKIVKFEERGRMSSDCHL